MAVKNNLVPAIKDFKVINPRLTVLILETKWFKVAFVNAHAPTEEKNDEEKEEFYALLKTSLEELPKGVHNNFIKRFQCTNWQRRIFQTDYRHTFLTSNLE